MKAAIFKGKGAIALGERPDPTIKEPTDAVVRVVLACVCGSDLWFYRGETDYPVSSPVGHEFLGVVEQVGESVQNVAKGDLVIAPFLYSDGTCPHCRAGITSACVRGGVWGANGIDGGQGEAVRVPLADGTLVTVPGSGHSDETLTSLLTLSDVMCTGHHAAVSAEVKQGDTVAVVGDGAVGLCAIIAAKRFGAQRIIALSRNPARQALARAFGATDILPCRAWSRGQRGGPFADRRSRCRCYTGVRWDERVDTDSTGDRTPRLDRWVCGCPSRRRVLCSNALLSECWGAWWPGAGT